MRNFSITKRFLFLFVLPIISLLACVQDDGVDTSATQHQLVVSDSVLIKCLSDMDFVEEVDTIFLKDGILTCKLGKYENCAFSQLDTFYFKNDTLDLRVTSADGELLACDCYLGIYARFSYPFKKPKALTVNGHMIGSGHGLVIATEEQ